ncbi:MAG: branched-chain amino acid ABC transporter substrate-binding protein [Alphaproteobacteria bacterium]|nr:MAG: branched-chain amino acid ABC transporter substrate-binding protein [Alphaproteobacteria bacterium]
MKYRVRVTLLAGLFAVTFALTTAFAPVAQAQDKDPIKIGFSMALTGALAGGGKQALEAMKIWRDDINAKGGMLGRPVELVFYDDQTNPKNVPGIYAKLLDVDKVDFIVSGYGTNLIAPAMPIAIDRDVVFMGLFGMNNNGKWKYDKYFQILPAGPNPAVGFSSNWFKAIAKFKPKTIALVAADAEFARNLKEGALENAKAMGLEIVYNKNYPPKTVDFTPIIRAVNAKKPDIFYIASYPNGSAGMVRALAEVGTDAKAVGGGMVGLQFSGLMSGLGPNLNGILNYDFFVPEPTMALYPGAKELIERYQNKVKTEGLKTDALGYYLVPWAYAYLDVLGQAVNAVGKIDHDAIAKYIHKTEFTSVVGKIKFGENGEWTESRTIVVQYQGIKNNDLAQFARPGTRKIMFPADIKTGEVQTFNSLR